MTIILIVDDEKINRMLLSILLKQEKDYVIAEAANGQEAVDLVSSNKYDIILMDINMPIMNGFTATKYIRDNIDKKIPIVAITANDIKGKYDEYMGAGFTELIQKPIVKDNVIEIINRLTKKT